MKEQVTQVVCQRIIIAKEKNKAGEWMRKWQKWIIILDRVAKEDLSERND